MIAIVVLVVLVLGVSAAGIALYLAASPFALLMWPAFLVIYGGFIALQQRADRLEEQQPRGRHRR